MFFPILSLYARSGIQKLPDCLRHAKNLRSLELAYLHLQDLPDWLPEIADRIVTGPRENHDTNEATVYLCDTTAEELKDMSIFDQSYEMVVKWFEDRRLGNYNFFGARMLYLLTYVDADPSAFAEIWEGYQSHIKTFHPGQFTYSDGSYVDLNDTASGYVKTAKCQYTCGGDPITVYHIFTQIPVC